MNCIKKLCDEDFGLESIPFHNPRHRFGARGIIFNQNNDIALLNKKAKNEYKLIGGGLEDQESPDQAFKREALEETGCIIEIDDCLGTFEELKSQDNFKQTSYVYVAHVIDSNNSQHLTKQEIDDESQLLWCPIEKAIELVDCESKLLPSKYETKSLYHTRFIVRRDYEILRYYSEQFHIELKK